MATRWYRLGTVAATNGTKRIDGTGTLWVTGTALKPQAGDLFTIDFANFYEVEGIVSDTEINIYDAYRGADVTGSTYAIVRNASVSINTRVANMVSQALNQKQRMLDEFDTWLTEKVIDPVTIHDSLGNAIEVKPLPILVKEMQDLINDGSTIPDLVQEAKDAAALAKRWASDPEDDEVEIGLYSSFHYSRKSSASATQSATSATESATSATGSASSAASAAVSSSAAATSEGNAATSETNAQGFRNEAETFRDEAVASATSAAASAVAADGSATKSEQWANYSYNNVVPGETEYSSKHYSVVAFNEAERAKQYADGLNAVLVYQGVWDPLTGAYPPDQPPSFTGTQFWIVSKDASFDGIDWKSGDNIVWNRTSTDWDRIEAAQVYSVNGERGAVVLGTDKIPFNNAGTNIVGTTAEAAIKELDDRAESSTTHTVNGDYTIAPADIEDFTYTVLNLSGGNFTITIPDYQAPFSAVIELIPTSTLTGPVTLVAAGTATIISGDITFPGGQFGYIRLVLAGAGPRGNTWIPTSGRYIGTDFSSGLARATSFDASGATYSVPGNDVQTSLAAVLAGRLVDAVDADTLDTLQASEFGQLAATQAWAGVNTFQELHIDTIGNSLYFDSDSAEQSTAIWRQGGANKWLLQISATGDLDWKPQTGEQMLIDGNKVWYAGNMGDGSGLDADLLDGLEATQFLRSDRADTVNGRTQWTNTDSIKVPAGGDSQRTPTPELGDFRYNSDGDSFEGYTSKGWGAIAGGGGGASWDFSDTSKTLKPGEAFAFDVTSSALVATLPSSGAVGDSFGVGVYSTADNTLTVTSTLPIMGKSEPYTINTDFACVTFAYINATFGYKIVGAVGESEAPSAVQTRIQQWFDKDTDTFTIAHDIGFVDVRIGGDVIPRDDYVSNGTQIVLNTPLKVRSYVDIIAWNHILTTNVTASMVSTTSGGTVQTELNTITAAINSMFPVGSVVLRMDDVNPQTLYGGTWELVTGDASLSFGDGTAQTGTPTGDNAPAVPLLEHSHNYSKLINIQNRYPYNGGYNKTVSVPDDGWSAYVTTGDGTKHSLRWENDLVASATAGDPASTIDVRGARISINVWKRTA